MPLDPNVAQYVTLASVAIAVLAFVVVVVVFLRLSKLSRAYDRLVAGDRDTSFVEAIRTQVAASEGLRRDVAMQREDLAAARADLSDALRHVAVVRYDAFGDMGGRMSFSAALLDDAGDGMVLTSINGRSETRTYAKGVQAGVSDHSLSPEEEQAVGYATRTLERPDYLSDADLTGAGRRGRRRG